MESSRVLILADSADRVPNTLREILESPSASQIELQRQSLELFKPTSCNLIVSQLVSRSDPQLILLVLSPFAGETARTLVREIKAVVPETPLMLVIESCQPDEMIELLEAGVADFITAPFQAVDVLPRIWQILERNRQVKSLTRALKEKLGLKQLVGASQKFLAEIKKIPLVANCDANILISGETGTGKEVCARTIHYLSPRARKPLIPINCGATPVDLLENELFGHERGAFTGASRSQRGLIQEASGGTLFLDEIDCLPPLAQVKLLRFIQEKEYRPLGSTKIRKADVRIISATNSIIEDAVSEGRFRQDLFFRLNIIPLRLPPLRERREDIPLLVDHFLTKYAAEFKKQVKGFSQEAMLRLMLHEWPGNVRELEYVVQRAIALSEELVIRELDLGVSRSEVVGGQESFQEAKAKVVRNFEKNYICNLLLAHRGNITKAAQVARKDRRAFWQLIRKHCIDSRQFRPGALLLWSCLNLTANLMI